MRNGMNHTDWDSSALGRRGPWVLRAFRVQATFSWITSAASIVLGLAIC